MLRDVSKAVCEDRSTGSYAYTWWCNLVMPVIDAGGSRQVAEDAAYHIMLNAFRFKAPKEWRHGQAPEK